MTKCVWNQGRQTESKESVIQARNTKKMKNKIKKRDQGSWKRCDNKTRRAKQTGSRHRQKKKRGSDRQVGEVGTPRLQERTRGVSTARILRFSDSVPWYG